MTTARALALALLAAAPVAGCGDGSGPDGGTVDCTDVAPTVLAPGDYTLLDAADNGCVQIPAAAEAGAEHLYVALAAQGEEVRDGITAPFQLTAAPPAVAATASGGFPAPRLRSPPSPADAFHGRIRALERDLVENTRGRRPDPGALRAAAVPPTVGDERNFNVCESSTCDQFVDVAATARVVGRRVAIYLDDAAPANGYTQSDLDQVGELFDNFLYPIDTAAFGRESDLDGNEVVSVLLTTRVNQLSPSCNATGSVVAGYFFGLDLLPDQPNSNGGEVFFGLAPDPANPSCSISRAEALQLLPPVFVHEFMHMIGFAQSVLQRGATSAEETWLDEGLAHMAEELAGRQIPDPECQPEFPDCETRFIGGNIRNAALYLSDPDSTFLIEPDTSSGGLAERGANWLFVRWLADHHAATQPLGVEVTRALVQTTRRGSDNVEAVTGEPFDELVARWQMANYLEDLPGFAPSDETLQYSSWPFRAVYVPYPLAPDVTAGTYSHSGVLRGGSGKHLRIVQPALGAPVNLRLTAADGESALPDDAEPRIALIRLR